MSTETIKKALTSLNQKRPHSNVQDIEVEILYWYCRVKDQHRHEAPLHRAIGNHVGYHEGSVRNGLISIKGKLQGNGISEIDDEVCRVLNSLVMVDGRPKFEPWPPVSEQAQTQSVSEEPPPPRPRTVPPRVVVVETGRSRSNRRRNVVIGLLALTLLCLCVAVTIGIQFLPDLPVAGKNVDTPQEVFVRPTEAVVYTEREAVEIEPSVFLSLNPDFGGSWSLCWHENPAHTATFIVRNESTRQFLMRFNPFGFKVVDDSGREYPVTKSGIAGCSNDPSQRSMTIKSNDDTYVQVHFIGEFPLDAKYLLLEFRKVKTH